MRAAPIRVALAALVTASVLAGCGGGSVEGSGGNSGGDPGNTGATTETGSTSADGRGTDRPGTDGPGTDGPGTDGPGTDGPGTDGPGTDGPGPTDPPVETEPNGQPSPESTGPERPDSPDTGGLTVSLPDLPIGGEEGFNSDDEAACVETNYLGGDDHPIPEGASIAVTGIDFSSDIVEVGGPGCRGRVCRTGDVAFTTDARVCGVPVRITREPTGSDDGGDGQAIEELTMTMRGAVRCASGQQQVCEEFAAPLVADLERGTLDTEITIRILGSETTEAETSEPETSESETSESETTQPETTGEPSPSTGATTPTSDSSAETSTHTATSSG